MTIPENGEEMDQVEFDLWVQKWDLWGLKKEN